MDLILITKQGPKVKMNISEATCALVSTQIKSARRNEESCGLQHRLTDSPDGRRAVNCADSPFRRGDEETALLPANPLTLNHFVISTPPFEDH